MIRLEMIAAERDSAVAAISPTWTKRARDRADRFLKLGRYDEKNGIWSEVKPVYMKLQHYKCVFCERRLEGGDFGPIEWDLEHFRPKGEVLAWPDPKLHPHLHYPFSTGTAAAGYYWLAYELGNYAASCKVCNSPLKHTYFPVAGTRLTVNGDEQARRDEQAFLCYPLGDSDVDPAELIEFDGTTAIPVAGDPDKARRGRVIIDFFRLNEREDLHIERAEKIVLFGEAFTRREDGTADDLDLELIRCVTKPEWPHAACLRSFARLWDTDPARARAVFQACRRVVVTRRLASPAVPAI